MLAAGAEGDCGRAACAALAATDWSAAPLFSTFRAGCAGFGAGGTRPTVTLSEVEPGWGGIDAGAAFAVVNGSALAVIWAELSRGTPEMGGTSPLPGVPAPGNTVPCCKLPKFG